MTIKDLATLLKDKGIVGAGGAGFPSYAKLSSKADTVILNCAECEPLLRLHRQLFQNMICADVFNKRKGDKKCLLHSVLPTQ